MHLLTRTELTLLAEPAPGEPQVSLFMPTHRFEGVDADRLRWKNLLTGIERVLADQLRRPQVDALLAPARELLEDAETWQHMSDGLAMFLRPDWHRTYRVPAPMPTLATVGERLVMGPLLRLLSGDEHFLVLALSQREIRLMEGSRHSVEEVRLSDVPTSLRDVVEPQETRSDTMARPAGNAGRGGRAVFYGHGAGDRHLKDDEVVRFLRAVSTGLEDALSGVTSPMVLVGLPQLVGAYREVNGYGHVLDEAVDHNPDQLSVEELHERAWPVVERRLRERRAGVIDHFHELNGTGRVSSDLPTVAQAAAEGRVETLFVQADPWCWEGVSDDPEPVVRLGGDERYAACEDLDAAAVATLSNGGQVHATSQVVAPDSEVAAIFRY
ncbi:hypothetical protein I601_0633 [Nocardioides dokdonensis FR1436]|uniref:Uncharacterized protein n=1 Tax=Nocardioides dokdonensis FR1436 TaxID=1300347 RepID=A0A1A9GHZ8_9ACTN|nr:hypothetical protein [Nocardioides dokdonensis]ANH37085.1 hypothetical protein I601_0633 [Nocardioides dokdonensis FR1436]